MRAALAACVALAALGLGACGAEGDETATAPVRRTEERLTEEQRSRAFQAQQAISAYCGRLALSLAGEKAPPSAKQRAGAIAAGDRLVELARRKPAGTVQTGVDMLLFVNDVIENLEGLNCDSGLLERLERGLGA